MRQAVYLDWFKVVGPTDSDAHPSLSFRCPHCLHNASFMAVGTPIKYPTPAIVDGKNGQSYLVASTRVCPNPECLKIVFTLSSRSKDLLFTAPPTRIEFDAADVPPEVSSSLQEAIVCHAAGAYRAATIMVRRTLEELCAAHGATGKDLHNRLGELRSIVMLSEDFFDAMDELKILGNDAAHVEAKSYDNIDSEKAGLAIESARFILQTVYQAKRVTTRLKGMKK